MPRPKTQCDYCGGVKQATATECRKCWNSQAGRERRFWSHVQKSDGCWLWTGARDDKGYGIGSGSSEHEWAHRYSFALAFGPIPGELSVLHRCDNPPCVRPDHLFLGTQKDNVIDMTRKGRHHNSRKTHCKRGHLYDAANTIVYQGRRHCRECRRK